MNRQVAEEKLRQRFEASELSEHFEFLYRNWETHKGRRCGVRCKQCGETFETWAVADYFKGVQPRMICVRCGYSSDGNRRLASSSTWADEIIDFYIKGHTVRETADRFKLTTARVNSLVKERGVTNGRGWREGSEAENRKRSTEAEQRYAQTLDGLGFIYLGGYKNKKSSLEMRCKQCGAEFERTADFIKRGNVVCPECKKREAVARDKERRRIAEQNAETRRIEREWYRMTHPPKDERRERLLNKTGICEVCGKSYTVREYVESCGMKYARDNGVCSDECRRKKLNRSVRDSRKRRGIRDNHRARAKKYGCEYDCSVTLPRLIKRDGLRCAICGEMCEPSDRSWSKYFGAMSPTIDHIIPMAKGGGHTWDNVQVAHMICNSLKSDKLEKTG